VKTARHFAANLKLSLRHALQRAAPEPPCAWRGLRCA
jgi:hypothetical protein